MITQSVSVSQIPESIAEAHGRVQSLVERSGHVSLEELQAAVEYLLDIVKATRGKNG
jgi:thiamine biosynthesis protein ThiC